MTKTIQPTPAQAERIVNAPSKSSAPIPPVAGVSGNQNSTQIKTVVAPKIPVKVVSVTPRSTGGIGGDNLGQTLADQEKFIASCAKTFEPIVEKIVGLVDGARCHLLRNRAKRIFTAAQAEEFAENNSLSNQSLSTATVAGSRIAARRVKNPEMMDWIALAGVGLDMLQSTAFAISELNKIEEKRKRENQTAKAG